jgi:cell fate regulator YaaT (PSP1 superfamily)
MEITGIRLRNSYQTCYVDTNKLFIKRNTLCLAETEHGIDIGRVTKCSYHLGHKDFDVKGKLLRKTTEEDLKKIPDIVSVEEKAFNICREKATEKKLEMKLVSVKCLFDKTKIIFYFVSENRIDFRELVRDLASIFRTRIEMRQIGVRDESRIIGGYGPCGRQLCCVNLKEEFDPVSIKMAKEQNLNLNSLKISGMCGRLLCCLGYEYEVYQELNKILPNPGTEIFVGDKTYMVESVEPLKQTSKIRRGEHIIDISSKQIINNNGKFTVSEEVLSEISKSYEYASEEETGE